MAEPGSIAEKVKQQADIVRIVGDYVRLRKSGQNFVGLCPFHSEKTPSFAVHPTKQIFHCFGCGVGGDVFKFVMDIEKLTFPEAMKLVADKAGVHLPERRPRTPEEAKETRVRSRLVEVHEHAARFFLEQLNDTREGKLTRDYLHDRGLTDEIIKAFGIGYAPGAGDALVRRLKQVGYAQELIEASGLANKDERGTVYDRFRRRVMFPIHSESARLVAFGGRAMGDEMPKYLNSPETPIYQKSRVLYNLQRAKDAIRKENFAVMVEGYLDCIAAHSADVTNVVATCGTSLTETQVKLLARSTRNVVVSFDPDAAGVAATERSLNLLLAADFQVRVLALPAGFDPDLFVREKGAAAYRAKLKESLPYLDYLVERARGQFDWRTQDGKIAALNYLLPYLARMPNKIRRADWAMELASRLGIEEKLLREELRRAAVERREGMKLRPEVKEALERGAIKPAERRLLQIVLENADIRADVLKELEDDADHKGGGLERVFEQVLALAKAGEEVSFNALLERMPEGERRWLYELAFEAEPASAEASRDAARGRQDKSSGRPGPTGTLEEARSCLKAMRRMKLEAELRAIQQQIKEAEQAKQAKPLRELLGRKQVLSRELAELR